MTETINKHNVSVIAGHALATFLEPYHLKLLKHSPVYEFPVYAAVNNNASAQIKLCISTTVKCFGLTTKSWNILKQQHTDNVKELCLSLLKYVTENFDKARSMGSVYKRFRDIFPQEVLPVTRKNTQALCIIETKLNGRIVNLNEEEKNAITYLLWNHATHPDNLSQIESGGDNIFFGPPSNMSLWGGLKESEGTKALHHCLVKVINDIWSSLLEARSFFQYRINCLFSQVTETNPEGMLQESHTDLEENNFEETKDTMKVMPMIAFSPMNEDGCMLAIWTDEYNSWQNRKNFPGQYFLYVPFGVLVVLPGNCQHAGGFCFGGNNNSKVMPTSHALYTNPRLHFFFCPNQKTLNEMKDDEEFDNKTNNNEESNIQEHNTQKTIPKKYHLDMKKFKKVHDAILTDYCCSNCDSIIVEEDSNDSDCTDDDSDYTENDKKLPAKRKK